MTVYVDDAAHRYGRLVMCHMASDTSTDELLDMAARLDLQPRWIQHVGRRHEHFDVSRSKRAQAVRLGAVECTQREMIGHMARRWGTS